MVTFPPRLPMPKEDLWVFAYGSLMWKPGFSFSESRLGRLHGYHRALCVHSVVHRGTQQRPGLVFGLDAGGSCVGMVFRVPEASVERTAAYLVARELVTPVYRPRLHRIHVTDATVEAVAFVVDRGHWQYAGKPPTAAAVETIAMARGHSGANRDYFANTLAHLRDLGIDDSHLEAIDRGLRARSGGH